METRKALVVVVWKAKAGAKERKVLLLRLTPERGSHWQNVTGKVENGESFAEGALREAEEETGFRFERFPQYLGLEHQFNGRWGPAHEKCFYLALVGGTAPPIPTLDPKEHVESLWTDPETAAKLVPFPIHKAAIERAAREAPPLLLTKRGVFLQDGEEITHARTAELLHRSLARETSGAFKVSIGQESLDVVVEDVARFVLSYESVTGTLLLAGGFREKLRPDTLQIRSDHSWTCALANDWTAVFLPQAYYQITKDLRPGSVEGEYFLHFLGRDYLLRVPH